MAIESDGPAPYGASSTVMAFIDRFRNRGLPSPITPEVLQQAGIVGSTSSGHRLIQTVQMIDLLNNDNTPTDLLTDLARASTEEYPQRLAAVVQAAYGPILQFVDPAIDGPERIRDAFRGNVPQAQQARMARLFLGLCQEAGLAPPTPAVATKSGNGAQRRRSALPDAPARRTHTSSGRGRIPAPVAGLLEALPPSGEWTEDDKERFLTTFETVLDYAIRVVDSSTLGLVSSEDDDGGAQ